MPDAVFGTDPRVTVMCVTVSKAPRRPRVSRRHGDNHKDRIPKRSRDYAVTVFSLVHPEFDPQKITRAVMAAFEDRQEATSGKRPRRRR